MTISLGSNIVSLEAQRQLNGASNALAKTYQQLSSGQRINQASDDAAGLAIADSLHAKAQIASVAIRNANDGVSTISIADSALSQVGNTLDRLAELSEQSANGVYSTTQRSALQNEFTALGSEIERIANTTEFNGVKLISGGGTLTLQVGFDSGSNSRISFTGVQGTLQALGLASAGLSNLGFSISGSTIADGQSASQLALDAINGAIGSLASTRGVLGATQSRLQVAIANLTVAQENFTSAESQIRDVDVASAAANLTRLGILQQAGASILAQANQQPSLALKLLQ